MRLHLTLSEDATRSILDIASGRNINSGALTEGLIALGAAAAQNDQAKAQAAAEALGRLGVDFQAEITVTSAQPKTRRKKSIEAELPDEAA